MSPLKYKVFAMLIVLAYLTLDRVYADQLRVFEAKMVTCLKHLTECFRVHTFEPITVSNFRNNPWLTKERCVKYALLNMKDSYDRSDSGIKINGVANLYYYSFNTALDFTDILEKKDFCSTDNLTTRELQHLANDTEACLKELTQFPESSEEAVQHAFYKVCLKDFKDDMFATAYMNHMGTNVKLIDTFESPEAYCNRSISNDWLNL